MSDTNNQRTDDLIRKIRALRAKAERTDNEHEAATFAAKVQEMLAAHGLEEAALRQDEQHDDVGLEQREEKKWMGPSRRHLVHAASQLYMCRVVWPRRGASHKLVTIVGRKHNVIVMQDMLDYLFGVARRLSKEYSPVGSIQADFRRGCFLRLAERLRELRAQQVANKPEWRSSGNPGNLPALYQNEQALTNKKLADFGLHVRSSKTSVKQGDHAAAGRAAAEGIGLSPQIGGGRGSTTHLLGRSR